MIREEVLKTFSGKNVLITGGTGHIDRQLVNMLCDAGAHVRIVSIDKVFDFELCFVMPCGAGFEAML